MWSALRRELRLITGFVLLPGLAAVLPWRFCFPLFRRIARRPSLYREEAESALAQARQWVSVGDERDWLWRYRLGRLVDHADFWRSKLLSAKRQLAAVDAAQSWPPLDGAAVGVFFHWCPGLLAVLSLRQAGRRSAVLAGKFSPRSMGGSRLAYLYGRSRIGELERVSGRPLIYAPGTVKRALADLAEGHWVIGTPDVPPTETSLGVPVRLFERPAWFAEGLLLIARRAQVPIVIFTLALDLDTGRRELRVSGPFDPQDPQLLQRIVDYWQALLQEKSWAFTLWPAMPAWFTPPAPPA